MRIKENFLNQLKSALESQHVRVIILNKVDEVKSFVTNAIPENTTIGIDNPEAFKKMSLLSVLYEKGNKILSYWKINSTNNRNMETFDEPPKPDYFLTTMEDIGLHKARSTETPIANTDTIASLPNNIIAFAALDKLIKRVGRTSDQIKDVFKETFAMQVPVSNTQSTQITLVLFPS
jgi:hypothetical protein